MAGLGDQWNDGDTGVSTNDGDVLVGWISAFDFGNEAGGTDNVESGDTKQPLRVVDALALEDLGNDRDSRVDLDSSASSHFLPERDIQGWR